MLFKAHKLSSDLISCPEVAIRTPLNCVYFAVNSRKTMSSDFNKGVKIGLIIYGSGILLTMIVHLILGWDYAHAPPPSFVIVLITLMIGLFRFFPALHRTMTYASQKAKGELVIHAIVALLIIGFVVWVRYHYQ